MESVGLRKGGRRAIHLPGIIAGVEGDGPYSISVEKLGLGGELARFEIKSRMEKGPVWIVITPKKGVEGPGAVRLDDLEEERPRQLRAHFNSQAGPIVKAEILLDNRGRAAKLRAGEEYQIILKKPKGFYQAYERGSIPAGGRGRSEPEVAGDERVHLIQGFLKSKPEDRVLDCATGIKGYLKAASQQGCRLYCLNYSLPMLERTREWLGLGNIEFIRYDSNMGLPFKDSAFQNVIVDALLEYLENPSSFLSDCARLIKPGGRLILLEPSETVECPEFYPQDLWELALWRPTVDKDFSKENLEKTLKDEGLTLVDRRIINFTYPLYGPVEFFQSVAVLEKLFI